MAKKTFLTKKISFFIFFMLFIPLLFAQTKENPKVEKKIFFDLDNFIFKENNIFSLDTGYLLSGLKNNGWGLGLSYEQKIFSFLSLKGDFWHSTLWPKDYDAVITTVGISLSASFYPFNRGLNFLYIGFGSKTDFMMYSGSDVQLDHQKDTLIRIYPQIGWKQSIGDYVFIDIFYNYRFLLTREGLPEFVTDITNNGNGLGIKLKFNLQKIWDLFF